jgi:hypothetical protein
MVSQIGGIGFQVPDSAGTASVAKGRIFRNRAGATLEIGHVVQVNISASDGNVVAVPIGSRAIGDDGDATVDSGHLASVIDPATPFNQLYGVVLTAAVDNARVEVEMGNVAGGITVTAIAGTAGVTVGDRLVVEVDTSIGRLKTAATAGSKIVGYALETAAAGANFVCIFNGVNGFGTFVS